MSNGYLWIVFFLGAAAVIFYCGLGAGLYFGYKRGIRDVVNINDASYRYKVETDTEEAKKRAVAETEEMKKRYESAASAATRINDSAAVAESVRNSSN